MKKIVLTLCVAFGGFIATQAQEIPERKHDGGKHHENHRMHGGKQLADLNLSEDQKAKLKSLNEEHRKKNGRPPQEG